MKILCGADETGFVKEVVCARGTDTSKKEAIQPQSVRNVGDGSSFYSTTKIVCMGLFQDKYLVAARLGGELSFYDFHSEEYELVHRSQLVTCGKEKFVSRPISLLTIEKHELVIVAYDSGQVFVVCLARNTWNESPVEFQLPGTGNDKGKVSAFTNHPDQVGVFAYGGKENDLKVVRLFDEETLEKIKSTSQAGVSNYTAKVLFAARNVKNDHLDMPVPIWITKVLFCQNSSNKYFKLVTTTKYGQIRVYDSELGKRPRADYKVTNNEIVSLSFADAMQQEVIVSDTHSLVARYSLVQIDPKGWQTLSASAGQVNKPAPKLMGKYSAGGNSGAILGVDVFENSIVAIAGLDRYVKVYDIDSRDVLAKVYLGVQSSDLVIVDDNDVEPNSSEQDGVPKIAKKKRRPVVEKESGSEDEELWKQLDENQSQIEKKKKRRL